MMSLALYTPSLTFALASTSLTQLMQIYANTNYIQRRAKLGRRASLLGLAILAIGMVASFAPGWIDRASDQGNSLAQSPLAQWLIGGGWLFVAFGALFVGFVIGQAGNHYMRRFQRSPRSDEVVAKALKGFDDRNHLYAWSTPGDLVFAGPTGIYSIATRDQGGNISIVGDRVRQPFSLRRALLSFGQEGAGAPVQDAQASANKLGSWLQAELSAAELVAVNPLVVFINEKAQLEVEGASAPIVHIRQLKQYLRSQTCGAALSRETLKAAIERLDAEAERRGAEKLQE